MKDTLIKIKNNLQGSNSRTDETENQINDLEHREAKNPLEQQEEKEKKKTPKCKQPLGQLQVFQYSHHRGAKRRGKARNWRSV